MGISLYPHQRLAVDSLDNGKILQGGVGSGKSRTALAYFYTLHDGDLDDRESVMKEPRDLYIITTAKKRDNGEWNEELLPFLLSVHEDCNYYNNKVVVDSWNNIKKYKDVHGSFFIFDEQRLVGSGAWVKAFLNIVRKNKWILLTATPGDTWMDYVPVFVANGFFKNKTEFIREHVVYSRFSKYPKVDRYLNERRLSIFKTKLIIEMHFDRHTIPYNEILYGDYDKDIYKRVIKDRWNPYENEPIINAAQMCYLLRKVVNSHPSRAEYIKDIHVDHPKIIIFYNFNYELDILKNIDYGEDTVVAEWNGHRHEDIPKSDRWVYLVQYAAGNEGWNCIETDTIIFYSQNYSYKVLVQASGRIDRLNTPFTNLYYYHIKSRSGIDVAISKALSGKKQFNELKFARWEKLEKPSEEPIIFNKYDVA